MPDKLIVPPPPRLAGAATEPSPLRPDLSGPVLRQAGLIVGLFVVGGLIAGLATAWLWSPPDGMVYRGKWYRGLVSIDPPTIAQNVDQSVFAATGWFSVCAIVLGLLIGVFAAIRLARSELVTLAALAVGGTLGGLLMWLVTTVSSPDDPRPLAKGLKDGTVLPDHFHLASGWLVVLVPGAAMLALMVIYLMWGPTPESGRAENAPAEQA